MDFDLMEVRPYNNTLQTIAAGYLAMAALVCAPMKWRIAVPVACFVLYGLVVHFCGDYSMTGNAAEHVEQAVLSALLPEGSKAIHEVGELGYHSPEFDVAELRHLTPVAMLFQAGYLTVKDYRPETESYTLGVPDDAAQREVGRGVRWAEGSLRTPSIRA